MIIGLVGFASSGKDTAANFIVDEFGFEPMAFADSIKDCLASIFCWDRDLLQGHTPESRIWREQVDPWWAERLGVPEFTPRWAMTNFGTDLMRRNMHEHIWIMNTERRIAALGDRHIVIKDCRFSNELDVIRGLGGSIVRIKRGLEPEWFECGREAASGSLMHRSIMKDLWAVHESEWAWIGAPIDHTIENDGTIDDLGHRVRDVVCCIA